MNRIIQILVLVVTSGVVLHAQSDTARDDYNFAAGLFDRGLHDRAAKAFGDFLDKWSGDARAAKAHFFLAQSLVELGRGADAVTHFTTAAKDLDPPTAAEARFRAGEALVRAKNPKDALPLLATAAAAPEATPQIAEAALYFLGEALTATGDATKAEVAYQRILETYAKGKYAPFSAVAVGYIRFEAKDYAGAIDAFGRARTAEGETGLEARVMVAEALERAGRAAEAVDAFTALASAELGNFETQVRTGLVRALAGAGELDRALKAAERMMDSKSDAAATAHAGLMLAAKLHAAGRFAEGAKLVRRVGTGEKEKTEALFWSALLDVDGHAVDASKESIGSLLKDKDAGPQRLFSIGDALSRAERYDEAVGVFTKAREAAGKDDAVVAEIVYAHAFAEHALGHFDKAASLLDGILKRPLADDLKSDVLFALAENRFSAKKFDAAALAYGRVIDEAPGTHATEAGYKLAWCLYEAKKWDEAISRLEKVLSSGDSPFNGDAAYLLGKCHEAAGRPDDARRAFARAATAGGKGSADLSAKARLGSAIAARKQGDLDSAYRDFASLASNAPNDAIKADASLGAADTLFEAKKFAEAERAWTDFLGAHADHPRAGEARIGRAWALREAGKHADAARAAAEALSLAKDADAIGEAAYLTALEESALEHWDGAQTAAADGMTRAPKHARTNDLSLVRGIALARLAKYAEAEPFLAQASGSKDPRAKSAARYERSLVLFALGRAADAEATLVSLLEEEPKASFAADGWFRLGEASYARKDFVGARTRYAAAREAPGSESFADKIAYKSAWVLRELKTPAEAAAMFRAIAKDHRESPLAAESAYLAGEEFEKAGDAKHASEAFAAVAQIDSKHELATDSKLRRVLAALASEDYDTVIREGPAAAAIEGADPGRVLEVRSAIGDALFAKKNWKAARTAFKIVTAASEGPLAARAQFHIGRAHQEAGEIDDAIDAYLKGSILYAHVPWAPRSALVAGDLFVEKKLYDRARKVWEELVRDFAASEEAKAVPARLQKLAASREAK